MGESAASKVARERRRNARRCPRRRCSLIAAHSSWGRRGGSRTPRASTPRGPPWYLAAYIAELPTTCCYIAGHHHLARAQGDVQHARRACCWRAALRVAASLSPFADGQRCPVDLCVREVDAHADPVTTPVSFRSLIGSSCCSERTNTRALAAHSTAVHIKSPSKHRSQSFNAPACAKEWIAHLSSSSRSDAAGPRLRERGAQQGHGVPRSDALGFCNREDPSTRPAW